MLGVNEVVVVHLTKNPQITRGCVERRVVAREGRGRWPQLYRTSTTKNRTVIRANKSIVGTVVIDRRALVRAGLRNGNESILQSAGNNNTVAIHKPAFGSQGRKTRGVYVHRRIGFCALGGWVAAVV